MVKRILVWHNKEGAPQGGRIGPTYHMEVDYSKMALRLYTVTAPAAGPLKVDIFDDGASIFRNQASWVVDSRTGARSQGTDTNMTLPKGVSSDDASDSFATGIIAKGSWVHCIISDDGGAKDITIQLELEGIE